MDGISPHLIDQKGVFLGIISLGLLVKPYSFAIIELLGFH